MGPSEPQVLDQVSGNSITPCLIQAHSSRKSTVPHCLLSVGVQVERVKSICKQHGGHEFRIGTDPEETKALWRARKEALWSACAAYPEKEAMITDVCVPLSNLPRIIGQPPASRQRAGPAHSVLIVSVSPVCGV